MTKGTKILLLVASAALTFFLIPSLNATAASAGETFTNPNNGASYEWKTRAEDGALVLYKNGALDSNEFVSDGSYTYYCQADGTVMTDQLSYHPDGQHIIYFDWQGHEVFNSFTHVSRSISGQIVDDQCYFNANGYMYTNTVTYDSTGTKLYYINPQGQMEHNGWFTFDPNAGYGDTGSAWTFTGDSYIGFANYDGSLVTNADSYTADGKPIYFQANGEYKYTSYVDASMNAYNMFINRLRNNVGKTSLDSDLTAISNSLEDIKDGDIESIYYYDLTNDGVGDLIIKRSIKVLDTRYSSYIGDTIICAYSYINGALKRIGYTYLTATGTTIELAGYMGFPNGLWKYGSNGGYLTLAVGRDNKYYVMEGTLARWSEGTTNFYCYDPYSQSMHLVSTFSVEFIPNWSISYDIRSSYGQFKYYENSVEISEDQFVSDSGNFVVGGPYDLVDNQ